MEKFTPGPWRFDEAGDIVAGQDIVHLIAIPAGENYAQWRDAPDGGEAEFAANARLITAAPDLYEALDWALAEAEGRTRYSPDYYSAKEQRENCINKCRAALRKAAGEPA